MKKWLRKALLSVCMTTAVATASAATAILSVSAETTATATDTTRFEMVDGASIRLARPKGLRFMAEIGQDVYDELMTDKTNVVKQLGMFIMPYEYLSDPSKYSDGATGVAEQNYENITTKINHVFYSSDDSVANKIYQTDEGYYRINGVVGNLNLTNYDREFIGIAYVSETTYRIETVNNVSTKILMGTRYFYADFNETDNVRSAVYVATQAHEDEDYKDVDVVLDVFEEYVYGAHLSDLGMTETATGEDVERTATYTYDDATYDLIADVVEATGMTFSVSLDQSFTYLKDVGDTAQLTATVKDNDGTKVAVNDLPMVWSSSDEKVLTVDEDGTVTGVGKGTATVTATCMGARATCDFIVDTLTFDTLNESPNYILDNANRIESFSIVEMNGGKVLQATTTSASTTDVGAYITTEALGAFFADDSVEYLAFDLKSGATKTGSTVYYHGSGATSWTKYESGGYDSISTDSFKTYYFPRSEYDNWVSKGVTSARFVMIGGSLVCGGESFYIDNLRGVTADEYVSDIYGFEYGGLRVNDGGQTLLFYPRSVNDWAFNIQVGTGKVFTNPGYTNENVTEGNRALQFTKDAGNFNINFTGSKVGYTDIVTKTGYYAVDIYVPAESDATMSYHLTTWAGVTLKKGAWSTVYANSGNNIISLTDTTGGTYKIDNMRSITEEEYNLAGLSIEANVSGLRTKELGDSTAHSGVAYYYGGADHKANTFSFAFMEGNGTGDTDAIQNVRYENTIVHSGAQSLAIEKGSGYMYLTMRNDSTAYSLLKNGFTFWVYSTVAIDGVNTSNFVNGVNGKFNDGAGVYIPANTWTKIAVTAADMNPTRFLIIQGGGATAGTIYFDDFRPAEDGELPLTYNATVEEETEDGTRKGVLLEASTHTYSNQDALPQDATDTEDMSYIKFNGSYGLNDYLVFDFTGDNIPIMSFFDTKVWNTIYNQAEDENVKGWIVANGMTTASGLTYGGLSGAHARRLAMIGPYKISYKYDDNGYEVENGVYTYKDGVTLTQIRANEGSAASPSPISMAKLQETPDTPYRMIIGWTENGAYMNLRIHVIDLTTGQTVADYDLHKSFPKADWEGDIALYGHFGRETKIDALYPIEEDTTMEAVLEKYAPSLVVYNGAWDDEGGLTLNQSTSTGGEVNSPTSADMSYIAFNGKYGLNDYVVFDFTGDNMPIVSFFNNTVTNTVFNNASANGQIADIDTRGWVWFNGLYKNDGTAYGGETTTNVHWQRMTLVGSFKVVGYDNNNNAFRLCWGSASSPNPISIYSLRQTPDTPYRMIIGIGARNAASVNLEIGVINKETGKTVYETVLQVSNNYFEEGSIALHGQFGKTTVLDKVFGVEEDTTLNALLTKYADKDVDYSDEEAVTLDRYAYASLSDGQWTLDGADQVTNPTDYRELDSSYTTYAEAGFNIILAQDMIATDGTKAKWEASADGEYMNKAYNAGLKVILYDWHITSLSMPLKVKDSSVIQSEEAHYPAWIIKSDLVQDSDGNVVYDADGYPTGTTEAAQEYIEVLRTLGIIPKYTYTDNTGTVRYNLTDRDALDRLISNELATYKDHPAFYGIMLGDEPSYHNAYCYGEVYNSIKRVMPDCYVQYNLLPMEHSFGTIQYRYPGLSTKSSATNAEIEAAYKSYVEGFLESMNTDYVQYDDYPMKSAKASGLAGVFGKTEPYVDPTALRNIQLIAEIAKERDLDVKVVSQSSVMRSGGEDGVVHNRQITENDARWLNNYLMGFGVKQINYFTYWTKRASTSDGEYFDDGGSFVYRDGTPTALYTFMQTIMADNTKFAPTITHFDYNASQVFGSDNDSNLNNEHISWSSSLTATASFRWLSKVETGLEYTLVTELYDKDKYNYMYMVMNTIDPNYGGTQSITVTLDSSVTKFYVYDQSGNRTLQEGNTYTVSLTAGQAVYIMPCAW